MSSRLRLVHAGRTFLDRRGFECRWFGVYLHHIAGPDPGLDLHDHPWPFVSLILRGSYRELWAETRSVHARRFRTWRAGTVHYLGLHEAHRIVAAEPGTWTLCVRGRKRPTWGFYVPAGWVAHSEYDYATRRPVVAEQGA